MLLQAGERLLVGSVLQQVREWVAGTEAPPFSAPQGVRVGEGGEEEGAREGEAARLANGAGEKTRAGGEGKRGRGGEGEGGRVEGCEREVLSVVVSSRAVRGAVVRALEAEFGGTSFWIAEEGDEEVSGRKDLVRENDLGAAHSTHSMHCQPAHMPGCCQPGYQALVAACSGAHGTVCAAFASLCMLARWCCRLEPVALQRVQW